jgi:hypothetical protein
MIPSVAAPHRFNLPSPAGVLLVLLLGGPSWAQAEDRFHDRAPELQRMVGQIAAQLEQSYGSDADEYTRRHGRLGEAITAWNASPRSDVDFELMTGWLRAAQQASLAGSRRPLPPLPQFMKPQFTKPHTDSTARVPNVTAAPPAKREPVAAVAEPPARATAPPVAPTTTRTTTRTAAPPRRSVPLAGKPDGLAPIYRTVQPNGMSYRERTDESPPAAERTPAVATEVSDQPATNKIATTTATTTTETLPSARAEPAKSASTPPTAAPRPETVVSDREPNRRPRSPRRSTSAADQSDPFRDDPPPAQRAGVRPRQGERHVARRPSQPEATADEPSVNLPELRARIVGYERGLRKVEAQLMRTEPLPAIELTGIARALDDLLDQREFVALYWGTLTRSEQRKLPELRHPESAVDLLAERIIEQRHALRRRGASQDDTEDHRRDLLLLQEASRRLTNIGGNAQPN